MPETVSYALFIVFLTTLKEYSGCTHYQLL